MDYYYSPNFIIPYTVKCKAITTLHDIIFLDMPEVNSGFLDTTIKKFLLKRCMKKSINVFTVSNFSKERIIHYFKKAATNKSAEKLLLHLERIKKKNCKEYVH